MYFDGDDRLTFPKRFRGGKQYTAVLLQRSSTFGDGMKTQIGGPQGEGAKEAAAG